MTWLVAGLGNPGERYARTRHNAGAMVADILAARAGGRFKKVRFLPLDVAEIRVGEDRVLLAKSHRYMNESGPTYAGYAKKQGVGADGLVAVHDEIELPFGSLKVKRGGSTAGHNGLNSLVQALRTPDFYRVRLGVGRPPGRGDPTDWVLQPFAKREQDELSILLEEAADAALTLIEAGLARAMDRHNRNASPG
ncbi:MAG: aminoacyl-tRNA hydrolase [Actinomycetota bacterium]